MTAATPFELHVPEPMLVDLRERLARTRYAERMPGEAWAYGTDPDWLRATVEHWRERFDWRAHEARLNAFPQYKRRLEGHPGLELHYLHVPGKGPKPLPLLLSHGWPGSVFEFLELIPMLVDPAAHGGDAADAFTVVAPSLPGYGLSFVPGQPRYALKDIADAFAALMQAEGYERYAAQGGDWGAFVTSQLGLAHAERLVGIHLNLLPLRRDLLREGEPTPEEARYLRELAHWVKEEIGYQWIQGTRPATLAAALVDSPAGLAAWIGEKFRAWSDCDGDIDRAIGTDRMLADISLYWFTGCIGASFWPYYARMHGPWPFPDDGGIRVPTGYCEFPKEILRPPRSMAERVYTDIRRWSVMDRGGHFAAMEQPEVLAHELREFFRPLREG